MSSWQVSGPLVITTEGGDVRGVVDSGVRTWRGIPYAAPPVGELRFRAPRAAAAWGGIRDASAFGPVPPQVRRFGSSVAMSEDCLTLNVSAPRSERPTGTDSEALPVLVWIYGGAFTTGSAASPGYRGDRIVRRGDVIFVSLNYRLGALGWSDFRRYSTADQPIDANNGLRDIVAALEWVQRNIASFGGDPANVTVFGESAGAIAITALMCAPSAEGLFARAFAQSSAPGSAYGAELNDHWAGELAGILGIVDSPERDGRAKADVVAALRAASTDDLVKAVTTLADTVVPDETPGARAVAPVVDGDFLPLHPIDAFDAGVAHPVPLVIGNMAREGALFPRILDIIATTPKRIERMFAQTQPELRDRVLAAYPGYPSAATAIDVGGDFVFWYPSVAVAGAHSRRAPTWSYRFDYATPLLRLLGLGATHGLDIPFVFGTTSVGLTRLFNLLGGARTSKRLSARFQGALLSFAATGDPGARWLRYDEQSRFTRVFGKHDRNQRDPRRSRRLAWAGFPGQR